MKKATQKKRKPRKRAPKKPVEKQADPRERKEVDPFSQILDDIRSSPIQPPIWTPPGPLPFVSFLDIARIAAPLLSHFKGNESQACRGALRLIREADRLIREEAAKMADLKPKEEVDCELLEKEIERLHNRRKLKGPRFRKQLSEVPSEPAPFPLSLKELFAIADITADTGRKRMEHFYTERVMAAERCFPAGIDPSNFIQIGEIPPLSPEELENRWREVRETIKSQGIGKADFHRLAMGSFDEEFRRFIIPSLGNSPESVVSVQEHS